MSTSTVVALYPIAALLFAAFLIFVGVVQDVLGFLRDRQALPPVAARPLGDGAEGVPQNIDPDERLALVLAPLRRSTFHVVPDGRDPRSAA